MRIPNLWVQWLLCGRRIENGGQLKTIRLPVARPKALRTEQTFLYVSLSLMTMTPSMQKHVSYVCHVVNGAIALVIQDDSWNVQVSISYKDSKFESHPFFYHGVLYSLKLD